MKKCLIKSGIIALGITTVMAIVNCILGKTTEEIIGIKSWGGEISKTYGFGISLTESYPLCTPEEQIDYPAIIGFAPLNFILTVLALFIVCFGICFIIGKCKKSKQPRCYTSEFCEVAYKPDYNVVFVKWKKFCCNEDYRAPLEYALNIIKEHENCDYVADTRSGFENIPEDTQWVADYFMPKAVEYGCKCIYFIIDENNSLKEELEGQASDSSEIIAFQYIYSLDEVKK